MEADVCPVFHKYVPPPDAVRTVLSPIQIVSLPLIDAIGGGDTVTVTVNAFVHPFPSVPITVYDVALVGETVIEPAVAPVFQEYDTPPFAASVVASPIQRVVLPVMPIVGAASTVTGITKTSEQPIASVTVNV